MSFVSRIIVFIALVLPLPALAQTYTSESYSIDQGSLSGGGTTASQSENYGQSGSFGEPVTGPQSGAGYTSESGFDRNGTQGTGGNNNNNSGGQGNSTQGGGSSVSGLGGGGSSSVGSSTSYGTTTDSVINDSGNLSQSPELYGLNMDTTKNTGGDGSSYQSATGTSGVISKTNASSTGTDEMNQARFSWWWLLIIFVLLYALYRHVKDRT